VDRLARSPALAASVAALLSSTERPAEQRLARAEVVGLLAPSAGPDEPLLDLSVLESGSGEVVAATDAAEVGRVLAAEPFVREARQGPFVQPAVLSPDGPRPAITVAAPLGEGAVLAGRVNLARLHALVARTAAEPGVPDVLVAERGRPLDADPAGAGPTFAAGESAPPAVLSDCLAGGSGTSVADDARGEPVMAAYRWLPDYSVCLVVALEQRAALAPVQRFGNALLAMSALALVAALVLAFVLARTITQPIEALQAGTASLARGERHVLLPETSNDELGLLAREFNLMARSLEEKDGELRAYAKRLETLVAELASAN
jgi:HAMP domain-containing protein